MAEISDHQEGSDQDFDQQSKHSEAEESDEGDDYSETKDLRELSQNKTIDQEAEKEILTILWPPVGDEEDDIPRNTIIAPVVQVKKIRYIDRIQKQKIEDEGEDEERIKKYSITAVIEKVTKTIIVKIPNDAGEIEEFSHDIVEEYIISEDPSRYKVVTKKVTLSDGEEVEEEQIISRSSLYFSDEEKFSDWLQEEGDREQEQYGGEYFSEEMSIKKEEEEEERDEEEGGELSFSEVESEEEKSEKTVYEAVIKKRVSGGEEEGSDDDDDDDFGEILETEEEIKEKDLKSYDKEKVYDPSQYLGEVEEMSEIVDESVYEEEEASKEDEVLEAKFKMYSSSEEDEEGSLDLEDLHEKIFKKTIEIKREESDSQDQFDSTGTEEDLSSDKTAKSKKQDRHRLKESDRYWWRTRYNDVEDFDLPKDLVKANQILQAELINQLNKQKRYIKRVEKYFKRNKVELSFVPPVLSNAQLREYYDSELVELKNILDTFSDSYDDFNERINTDINRCNESDNLLHLFTSLLKKVLLDAGKRMKGYQKSTKGLSVDQLVYDIFQQEEKLAFAYTRKAVVTQEIEEMKLMLYGGRMDQSERSLDGKQVDLLLLANLQNKCNVSADLRTITQFKINKTKKRFAEATLNYSFRNHEGRYITKMTESAVNDMKLKEKEILEWRKKEAEKHRQKTNQLKILNKKSTKEITVPRVKNVFEYLTDKWK